MTKPSLPKTSRTTSTYSNKGCTEVKSNRKRRKLKSRENSDVLISAVVSSYLLTHLHHVLQRAEYLASREGRLSKASNFAQLRKVLCMDARSMEDASALGLKEGDCEKIKDSQNFEQKAA